MWLKDGEFSRSEELYVAFILASEAIINKGPSAKVPVLPKRIWSDAEYKKALRWYTTDIPYRNKMIGHLVSPGNTKWVRQRQAIGALVKANKPEEAERLYNEYEWHADDLAEDNLALIRSCTYAKKVSEDTEAKWFFAVGSRRGGPVRFDQLKAAFEQGKLLGNCLVWREGLTGWQRAVEVECFAEVAYAGALPPALPNSK